MAFEGVGRFVHPKGFQYSKCCTLADGRIMFTPFNREAILLFDPASGESEEVGHFEGDCKWSGCTALPNGKIVFVPQYGLNILIFDPMAKTWEEVPIDPAWQKDPHFPKFSGCITLPDGRVLFVPYYYHRIVIFDPITKTWEEMGNFEGNAKWCGCQLLKDNRLVFVPFSHPSILIFDLNTKTSQMVGNWEGGFKWSGGELLADGRMVFAPLKYKSIVLFDAASCTWEEVGDFGDTVMKWNGIRLMPNGKVCFVPLDSLSVLIFDPSDKTWIEIPHGRTRDEEMPQAHGHGCRLCTDCAPLPDGRVVFVPCSVEEILIYTPASMLKPVATTAGACKPKPKVLITGAGGRTGSMVLEKMAKRPDLFDAIGTARSDVSAARVRAGTGAECRICDVQDSKSVFGVLTGMDTVVILHSATPKPANTNGETNGGKWTEAKANAPPAFAYPAGGEPEKIDWEGSKAVIDAAAEAGVKHIVLFSSMGGTDVDHFLNKIPTASGERGNIILWKRKAEMYLIKKGIPYTIIHPGGLLPFATEPAPEGQHELMVAVDDDFGNLPAFARSIPRGDVAELVLQCVANPEVAAGRSFDVVAKQPDPNAKKVWDKNLKSLLDTLGGKNTDYSKGDHSIVRF